MISVVDVDAETVATEIIVAVNGDIPISGSPSFLSGKAGELDLSSGARMFTSGDTCRLAPESMILVCE